MPVKICLWLTFDGICDLLWQLVKDFIPLAVKSHPCKTLASCSSRFLPRQIQYKFVFVDPIQSTFWIAGAYQTRLSRHLVNAIVPLDVRESHTLLQQLCGQS